MKRFLSLLLLFLFVAVRSSATDIILDPAQNPPVSTSLIPIYAVSGSTSTANKITVSQFESAILGSLVNTGLTSGTITLGNGSLTINAAGQVTAFTAPSNLLTTGGTLNLTGFGTISGVMPAANGGTGVATAPMNYVLAAPTGSSGALSPRALVLSDFPIQGAPAGINLGNGSLSFSPQGILQSHTTPSNLQLTDGTLSLGGFGSITGTLPNNNLANSAITIAGTSVSLGGSITLDTITGLSTTGILKRTGANAYAIAAAGTDYLAPGGNGSALTGLTKSQVTGLTDTDSPTFNNVLITAATLTYASTTNIDFTGTGFRTVTLTGDVTFTTSNLAAGRSQTIRIIGNSTAQNLTFPGTWTFVGAAAPASLAGNKTAILTLTSFGTTDANVIAAYAAQP